MVQVGSAGEGETMSNLALGTVKSAGENQVVLSVAGTNYELHLAVAGPSALKVGEDVRGVIRARARKVWTTAAGGNFISPLFGPPRVIQGKVKSVDGRTLVVQAGVPVTVELPADGSAYDLKNGGLAPGTMVNITTLGDPSFEPVRG